MATPATIDSSRAVYGKSVLASGKRGEHIREQMELAGVNFLDACSGHLRASDVNVRVRLETDDVLRLQVDADPPEDAHKALKAPGRLSGNVRFARVPTGWLAVAETQVNGVEHLRGSLSEITIGFQALLQTSANGEKRKFSVQSAADRLRASLDDSKSLGEHAVEIDKGWEVRPHIGGAAIPIEIRVQKPGVRLSCPVLNTVPAESMAAVIDQALRLNAQIRLARLSIWSNDNVVAEVRLRTGLITTGWLETASSAVAAASHHAGKRLKALAAQPQLAQQYVKLLLEA